MKPSTKGLVMKMFETEFVFKSLERARAPGTTPKLLSTKFFLPVPAEYVVFITNEGEILVGWLSFRIDSESGAMFPVWAGQKPGAQGQRNFAHKDISHWLG